MATNSYTSYDGTAKVEINDSTWQVKIYDLEAEPVKTLPFGTEEAQDLDEFISPGFKNGAILMKIAQLLENALT